MYTKEQQTRHRRRAKKRKQRGEFSKETIQAIWERDNYQCVNCGSAQLDSKPHHIKFKSQGGRGVVSNGVSLCIKCHGNVHTGANTAFWRAYWERWAEGKYGEDYFLDEEDRRGLL